MDRLALSACVLLLAAVATAHPGSQWRRAAADSPSPDRDVEAVEPVRGGGTRGGAGGRGGIEVPADASDESPEGVPFSVGIGLHSIGGFGGFGGFGGRGGYGADRPIIVRTLGLPGRRDSAEDSDEDLPGGYVSTGYLHPYFVDPMSNFMAQMAEMMAAMRRQMTQVMNRGGIDAGADGPDFSKLGNTTSTTKVVDGHVVTVNETVIGGEDGDSSVLHVRVIDIHPSESPADDSAESATPAPTPSAGPEDGDKGNDKGNGEERDVEPLESNEVPSKRPGRRDNEVPMKVGSEVDDLNG